MERTSGVYKHKHRSPFAIIIDDFGIRHGSRMLDYGASDGVYPFLLLLLGVGDEVHGVAVGGELEGKLLVEDVLGALDGEASTHRDDATWLGIVGDVGVLEPEELASFQDEPAATPGLDVLALLGEPAGSLGGRPEIHALVVLWLRVQPSSGSPQALHFQLPMENEDVRFSESKPAQRR